MVGFLKGTATALVTPFDGRGEVNYRCLEELCEAQIRAGASALVLFGSTGESWALDDGERERILRCALSAAGGRVKIIAGTGHCDAERAAALSRAAQKAGADGLLCVTPYYNKCPQKGLLSYYARIAGEVDIPVVCYNVPSRTGVNIAPETMREIAKLSNIAGIKEASGNMAQIAKTARLIRHKCDLYAGDDLLLLPTLALGGSAAISVASNLLPKQVCALVRAVECGNLARANKMFCRLSPLFEALTEEPNPVPVKEALNMLGYDAGLPRPPLPPMDGAKKRRLARALKEAQREV